MSLIKKIFQSDSREIRYKELFISGAYITIVIVTIIGTFVDYLIGSYIDIPADLLFFALSIAGWRYVSGKNDIELSAVVLFWIATLMEFIYLYIHQVDYNLMFAILIPIILFIALPWRKIVINLSLFYILLTGFLAYYYFEQPDNRFLHDPSYMLAYALMHIFMIFYGIFYYLAIDETLRKLEASNREKSLLLNEVHHRVKNNLNLVAAIFGLEEDEVSNPGQKLFLESNRRRIESMATLHEILYRKGTSDSADLHDYLGALIGHLAAGTAVNPQINSQIDHIRLPMGSLIQIGIMVNEMITNSIKHHDADTPLEIRVHFYRDKNSYKLDYCDNAGKVDTKKLESGFGFRLIRLAASHFDAKVTYTVSERFCYHIIFDKMEVE